MNKVMIVLATVAMSIAAIAEDAPKPNGMLLRRQQLDNKQLTLTLDKDLTTEKVEAYKAEVAARIDEIVRERNEKQAKLNECTCGQDPCTCEKQELPPARISLTVNEVFSRPMLRGPKGRRLMRDRRGPKPENEGKAAPPPPAEGEVPPPPPPAAE